MKLPLCVFVVAAVLIAAGTAPAFADGQAVYNANCAMCHNNMAPKAGDKDAWAARIKQGTDAMVASVIKGKGAMPARGGHANLSDADIKAAVEYIVSKSQ
ncbi:MAG: c-type cytochrome [Bradyrhizobium sp.]